MVNSPAAEKLFEATLPGFDGGTDATDHLVKWGYADSTEQVKAQYPGSEIYPMDEDFPVHPDDIDFDLRTNYFSPLG